MSEEKADKAPEDKEMKKKTEESESISKPGESLTAQERATLAEAEATAAAARLETARAAAEDAAEEEYKAAAKVASPVAGESFTNKRGQEQIFRREMGEPEFWLNKQDRGPARPILSKDEEEEISRKVEIPANQTPQYTPEHVLSPEFGGTSNYERGIIDFKKELKEKLDQLKSNPESRKDQLVQAEEDLKTLDYLYDNFYLGMNVFRTAKGGRDKIAK